MICAVLLPPCSTRCFHRCKCKISHVIVLIVSRSLLLRSLLSHLCALKQISRSSLSLIEFTFSIESSKWPYPDKLSVTIPVTSKDLKGTESKLEITRVSRGEELLIKGPDARAVRHAGAMLGYFPVSRTANSLRPAIFSHPPYE